MINCASPLQVMPVMVRQIPRGRVTKRALENDVGQEYFMYVPENAVEGAPVLVSVHGISHNAKAHAQCFAPFADLFGVVIVAPMFSGRRFQGFQRLGFSRRGHGERPDLMLHAILSEVNILTGARSDRVYLFGYSAGGQFAHRYAMVHPERVSAVAMGAPGWFTFPEADTRYPRGLSLPPRVTLSRLDPSEFFRIPMAVFVGERDDQRDDALNQSPRVDRQQGLTRIERGRRWVDAMRAGAVQIGFATQYRFRVLGSCGHSFRQCMIRGEMGWHVFEFFFQPTANHAEYGQAHGSTCGPHLVFNAA